MKWWRRVANSLGYELVKTEAEKDARSKNPDAVDLAMRGWALVSREQQQQRTRENNNAAKALFEQALRIDPNETNALAGDAYAYMLEYTRGWATARDRLRGKNTRSGRPGHRARPR